MKKKIKITLFIIFIIIIILLVLFVIKYSKIKSIEISYRKDNIDNYEIIEKSKYDENRIKLYCTFLSTNKQDVGLAVLGEYQIKINDDAIIYFDSWYNNDYAAYKTDTEYIIIRLGRGFANYLRNLNK